MSKHTSKKHSQGNPLNLNPEGVTMKTIEFMNASIREEKTKKEELEKKLKEEFMLPKDDEEYFDNEAYMEELDRIRQRDK